MDIRFARLIRFSCAAGLAAFAVAGPPRQLSAQDEGKPGSTVPIRRIVLFNSGVGFFEHGGSVEGDASVELKFNTGDVNDLLKSMVLEDRGGGEISTVTYASRDPVTRTLKTFAVDLTENPSLADLLKQVRGERIEVEAPNKIAGRLVSVETRTRKVGDDEVLAYDVLNVLAESGLRSVSLENIASIRLLNPTLNAELQQALEILATANDTDKKSVTLQFRGKGERPVRIGYIQEMPVWKTSYRLVLDEKKQPFLQGWAIVENTTEADWSNVDLTLVSGRPISFRMDLYQPLYVNRPLVVPELYSSLTPKVYGQDLDGKDAEFRRMAELGKKVDELNESMEMKRSQEGRSRTPPGFGLLPLRDGAQADEPFALGGRPMDPTSSVKSLAEAGDVGELFQYRIDTPVTLARQKSAMLPIVNAAVKGEKLSIYNPDTHPKHPLNGLRLKNSTDLHLMQGPITVFDGGAYAGDARVLDIPPKSERLISYAMDLDTEVAVESQSKPEVLVGVKIVKGTLYATRKHRRSQTYTVKNSGSKQKTVLIEYPFDPNWELIEPEKPAEKTRDLYRFAVKAGPGEPAKLTVAEERVETQTVHLTNLDLDTIHIYLRAKVVDETVKEALQKVVRLKQELAELSEQRRRREQEIATISQEQERIRRNMEQLDRTTDLYNRYVKKFSEQEDRIEDLRNEIDKLQTAETAKRKELDEFLSGLNVP